MASFDPAQLKVTLNPECPPLPPKEQLTFGSWFTPHMLTAVWRRGTGWEAPEIKPFAPLPMHPAASSLHYGLEIFEGMKAYLSDDDRVLLFRPIENARRMARSAERLSLPTFKPEDMVELIKKLVWLDRKYIPKGENMSLYIRPTMISIDNKLGVHAPNAALFYIILSPTGAYFSSAAPKIFATSKWSRACYGGVGDCKCGGNYAPTIMPQAYAAERGCSQVLWLTPDEHHYITEVGAMNFLMAFREGDKTTIVTAPLDGLILPGITRSSVLALLRERFPEYGVEERYVAMDDLVAKIRSGECVECFGCGTAAVITSLAGIVYEDVELPLPAEHPIADRIKACLVDIQLGRAVHGDWVVEVTE